MNKRTRRRVNREIAAVAKLKESEIDTSDVPEITDWSGAIVGRFYGLRGTATLQKQDIVPQPAAAGVTEQNSWTGRQPVPAAAVGMYQDLAPNDLIAQCVAGTVEAWDEFVRRWHRLIADVVFRTARRWEQASVGVFEDLVQDVYLRLAANEWQVLKEFKSAPSDAFAGYLKVVAANVVMDHFRAARAVRRSGLEPASSFELSDMSSTKQDERKILFDEIDMLLKKEVSERDRKIFWLYYRLGLTAKQIAAFPTIGVTAKGVESVLHRLTKFVRKRMSSDLEKHVFGNH
jgi:RNA polymerase sigma-70 factor (ECF subfamily)